MEKIKNSYYSVDTKGNVYGPKGNKLSLQEDFKGYFRVKVSISGKIKTKPVHRLVAETYIPNPNNLPMVNHIDGDKKNNCVENLEWVTAKQNSHHARDVLGIGIGETHSQAILSEKIVREICEDLQNGYRNIDIAKKYNIQKYTVKSIRIGASWKHVSKDYDIGLSRRENISDETFLWVCHKLEEGLNSSQIIAQCTSQNIAKSTISKIRTRKLRPHLSEGFNF